MIRLLEPQSKEGLLQITLVRNFIAYTCKFNVFFNVVAIFFNYYMARMIKKVRLVRCRTAGPAVNAPRVLPRSTSISAEPRQLRLYKSKNGATTNQKS